MPTDHFSCPRPCRICCGSPARRFFRSYVHRKVQHKLKDAHNDNTQYQCPCEKIGPGPRSSSSEYFRVLHSVANVVRTCLALIELFGPSGVSNVAGSSIGRRNCLSSGVREETTGQTVSTKCNGSRSILDVHDLHSLAAAQCIQVS